MIHADVIAAMRRARYEDVPGCSCGPMDHGCEACDAHVARAALAAAVDALPGSREQARIIAPAPFADIVIHRDDLRAALTGEGA